MLVVLMAVVNSSRLYLVLDDCFNHHHFPGITFPMQLHCDGTMVSLAWPSQDLVFQKLVRAAACKPCMVNCIGWLLLLVAVNEQAVVPMEGLGSTV